MGQGQEAVGGSHSQANRAKGKGKDEEESSTNERELTCAACALGGIREQSSGFGESKAEKRDECWLFLVRRSSDSKPKVI